MSAANGTAPAPEPARQGVNVAPVPRLALNIEEACDALGLSWKAWREHVEPHVKVVRCGRCKRVSVRELERWLAENGERVGELV